MEERRRTNRRTLDSRLLIKRLDGSGQEEAQIEIMDVSKTGVGFICDVPLSIGAVYETYLKIWTDEVIHAFLKVVRIEQTEEERYMCGTIFIGLPEMNAARIEVYDLINHLNEEA